LRAYGEEKKKKEAGEGKELKRDVVYRGTPKMAPTKRWWSALRKEKGQSVTRITTNRHEGDGNGKLMFSPGA